MRKIEILLDRTCAIRVLQICPPTDMNSAPYFFVNPHPTFLLSVSITPTPIGISNGIALSAGHGSRVPYSHC